MGGRTWSFQSAMKGAEGNHLETSWKLANAGAEIDLGKCRQEQAHRLGIWIMGE